MKIVIATGGTGGHIYPALALAELAKKRYQECDILFIGNDDRMEKDLIPAQGYPFFSLHASGLTGGVLHKMQAVGQMLAGMQKAKKKLKEFKPDIVIGFGGYVSAPVLLAAHALHIKTMIHEQNSIVGQANKFLRNQVDGIVICYEKCFMEMPKEKTRLLGNPRASIAYEAPFDEAYFDSLRLPLDKPIVLVVMGSLGSESINEMMVSALQGIDDVTFLYVTGKKDYENTKDKFHQDNVHVLDYVDQMAILKKIDLIVCRAGATTLAEITAIGVPSILIPSPYVPHNHQFYNANVLVEQNGAMMIEEKDLTHSLLHEKIEALMQDEDLRRTMSENAKRAGFPHAGYAILDFMDEIMG